MMIPVEQIEFPIGFVEYDIRRYVKLSIKSGLLEDITKNGIRKPILVRLNPKTNKYRVLNGKHRVAIAKHYGIRLVDVKVTK